MIIRNFMMAAAAAAALTAGSISTASAAPWDHRDPAPGREMHRPYVAHDRIIRVLRDHHYRVLGDPTFVRSHYVVRTYDRLGQTVFVEVDPYSGSFIGEIRL